MLSEGVKKSGGGGHGGRGVGGGGSGTRHTSRCPKLPAAMSGVTPPSLARFTPPSALQRSSARSTGAWPACAAASSGVQPWLAAASSCAPASSSTLEGGRGGLAGGGGEAGGGRAGGSGEAGVLMGEVG